MIIAVDVDGVCADLMAEWLARYNRDYGDAVTEASVAGRDLSRYVKPECGRKVYDYLHDADLYERVQPIAGALEGVRALRAKGHRVVFATATNIHQAGNKLAWLARHGFLELLYGTICKDYIELQDKSLVRADMLIDDGVHNLETFCGLRLLFASPHNAQETRFRVADSWPQVIDIVGKL